LFRALFFGEVLPNTFYAKMGGELASRLQQGVAYTWPLLICWTAAVLRCWQRGGCFRRWIWAGSGVFVVLWGGGDWMWWGRMLVPFTLIFALLLPVRGTKEIWVWLPLLWSSWQLALPYKAILAAYAGKRLPEVGFQEGTLRAQSIEQAAYFRKVLPAGSLIAVNHAGFLPMLLPEYRFLDMTGLNNEQIAKRASGGLHQKYDAQYLLEQEPDAVVFHRRGFFEKNAPLAAANYWVGEDKLWQSTAFQSSYVLEEYYWERRASGGGQVFSFVALRASAPQR
jgi:hypothetical protein